MTIDGAVVVISHHRKFCEKVGFTHVGTVTEGKLVLEQQRQLRDSDWEQDDIDAANTKMVEIVYCRRLYIYILFISLSHSFAVLSSYSVR